MKKQITILALVLSIAVGSVAPKQSHALFGWIKRA